MTQYRTDFSEYTADAAPSDWTAPWDTANTTWTVEATGGDIRGKYLSAVTTGAGERAALTWNDINADAGRNNIEILMRFRSSTDTLGVGAAALARARGDSTTETGMTAGLNGAATGTYGESVRTTQFRSGSGGSPADGTLSYAWDANTWYWFRVKISGSSPTISVQMRVWTGAYSAEVTSSWTHESTQTFSDFDTLGNAGLISVGLMTNGFDYFSAGTNGDAAPGPSISLTSHTVTDIAATTATIGITPDSADGTLYWFVSTSATPPTEAALKAGTGAAAFGSDETPTANVANTAAVTDLAANTEYFRHWFQESAVYKSVISTSTGFTTLSGVGVDPALRLDVLGDSRDLLDTDTGVARAVAAAEYVVLGGTAGSRTLVKQGTAAIVAGNLADITDGVSLTGVDDVFKVVLIAGDDDQGIYDATVVDRNA